MNIGKVYVKAGRLTGNVSGCCGVGRVVGSLRAQLGPGLGY